MRIIFKTTDDHEIDENDFFADMKHIAVVPNDIATTIETIVEHALTNDHDDGVTFEMVLNMLQRYTPDEHLALLKHIDPSLQNDPTYCVDYPSTLTSIYVDEVAAVMYWVCTIS